MPHAKTRLVYTVTEYPAKQPGKTVFFFCPLAIRTKVLAMPGFPIWRLRRSGYSVISYDFEHSMATESAELTLTNFKAMLEDAQRRGLLQLQKDEPSGGYIVVGLDTDDE